MPSEGFTARFLDGPLVEQERHFAVGTPWHAIELAPIPTEARPDSWVIVGGDGIPPDDDAPWSGQVRYRLAKTSGQFADYELSAADR
jgi:hypothetical protein